MIIPWALLGTLAAAALPTVWWARRRARAAGVDPSAPVDLATTVGLAALVGARAVGLAWDLAQTGTLPTLRGILTLGAGLSVPGAILGAIVAGVWLHRRGRLEAVAWRVAAAPTAAGLGLWSALGLIRGDAAGITAPPPLGWLMPGEAAARIPVGLLEAAVFALAAVWLARTPGRGEDEPAVPGEAAAPGEAAPPGPRPAVVLAALVAVVHLGGSLLRPSAPTLDGDLDVVLAVVVLAGAALAAAGKAKALTAGAAVSTVIVLIGVAVGVLGVRPAPDAAIALSGVPEAADLDGALVLGETPPGQPPAWGPDELAGFVAASGRRPVVVNFWASWCPPCHAEAPALARTARAFGDEVAFVGVLVDDATVSAQGFVERYALPFPTVADGGLRRAFGMRGLPTTIVLHADGTEAARMVGGVDARRLAAAIDRARVGAREGDGVWQANVQQR